MEAIKTRIPKRSKLSHNVFSDLKKKIMDGSIKTGEYLKTEAEMCDEYQVSRTTVRDAVSSLEEHGFVEKQQGKGVVVINRSVDVAIDAIQNLVARSDYSLGELFQVRDILERNIVVLASKNATLEDIEELRKWVGLMNRQGLSVAKYTEYDLKFHLTLAKVSKNQIFYAIVQGLYPFSWKMINEIVKEGGKMEQAHKFHGQILASIEKRDEEGSLQHMINHLRVTRKIVDEIEERGVRE
jgi:GntR family transcriptional repressor for pyruvate dehydrogenase complex